MNHISSSMTDRTTVNSRKLVPCKKCDTKLSIKKMLKVFNPFTPLADDFIKYAFYCSRECLPDLQLEEHSHGILWVKEVKSRNV